MFFLVDFLFSIVLVLFFFGLLLSLSLLPTEEEEDKSKLDESDISTYESDVLGQPIKLYNYRSGSYKPIRKVNLKVGLLGIVIFISSLLIFKNSKRVEAISGVGGYSYLDETSKVPTYKIYNDPMFPAEYTVITGNRKRNTRTLYYYEREWFQRTFDLESPPKMSTHFDTIDVSFKYLKEPYYTKD
jgi:hypothetical protein